VAAVACEVAPQRISITIKMHLQGHFRDGPTSTYPSAEVVEQAPFPDCSSGLPRQRGRLGNGQNLVSVKGK